MKSLRTQLAAATAVTLGAAAAGAGLLLWQFTASRFIAEIDESLRARAFALSRITEPHNPRLLPYIEQGLATRPDGVFLELFDPDGNALGHSSHLTAPLPFTEATKRVASARTEAVMETATDAEGHPVRLATFARIEFRDGDRETLLFARAGQRLDAVSARLRETALWLGAGGTGLWIAGTALVWWLTGRWLRPVTSLTRLLEKTTPQSGRLRQPLLTSGDPAVVSLAAAIHRLLDQFDSVHAAQQRFVADASHELRTPLTILRGEIDVALRKPRSAAEYCEVLQSSREEIEDLSRLTENLLLLARSDAGQTTLRCEDLDVVEIAREVAERLQPVAEQRQVAIRFAGNPGAPVSGDRLLLGRIFSNLIENALAYSPAGESVTLTFRHKDNQVICEVADTGAGVAPEQLPFLFDRFYRADQARTRNCQGAGLGLAIVRTCVEAHGGTVSVRSEVGRGTVFTVTLPSARGEISG